MVIVVGDKVVGFGVDYYIDVVWGEKGVDFVFWLVQQVVQGWQQGDVLVEKVEVIDVVFLCLMQGQGGSGYGGFEIEIKKDYFVLWILLCQLQSVYW